jgi:hypothetical protein
LAELAWLNWLGWKLAGVSWIAQCSAAAVYVVCIHYRIFCCGAASMSNPHLPAADPASAAAVMQPTQIDVFLVQQGSMDAAYGLVLLCVVLTAVGDGITQPTVYADAAVLPDKYTQVRMYHMRLAVQLYCLGFVFKATW